jgi:HSP20 family protein
MMLLEPHLTMALIKWEPLREIEDMLDRYSRSMGLPSMRASELTGNGEWCPRVDISENENEFQIHAELPGVEKDNVKVSVENGVLTLEGERHQEREEKGWRYHRVERSYGNFSRSFTLPTSVDASQLKAHFHDGLLEVDLPKMAIEAAKAVHVKVE